MSITPIKPSDVVAQKRCQIPESVIETFNEMIAEKWDGRSAVIRQCDVVERIVAKGGVARDDLFSRGWLNVEDVYEAEGWRVDYDKPAYCETYEPTFTFTKRRSPRR